MPNRVCLVYFAPGRPATYLLLLVWLNERKEGLRKAQAWRPPQTAAYIVSVDGRRCRCHRSALWTEDRQGQRGPR